jgi:uroporphyrinogen III methyltransferase/synthase
LPTIELRDPESFEPLDRALGRLDQYDWLIFTSANGVERFFRRLESLGRDARAIGGRVCAIGPATAGELRRHGVRADRTAAEFRAEGLVDALAGEELKGRRVLIPRAAVARDLLPKELEARGARVEVVETYRTVASKIDPERIAEVLGEADIITFTSSSTAQNCPPELRALPAASIGPVTTEAATRAGFRVVVEAREYTTGGLLTALESYFAR